MIVVLACGFLGGVTPWTLEAEESKAVAPPASVSAPSAETAAADLSLQPGLKVKVLFENARYPGTLVRIEGAKYIVKDDGSGKEYGYSIDRLFDAQGVPLAERLMSPENRAAAVQNRKQGVDYYVGLWRVGEQGVDSVADAKARSDPAKPLERGWLRISGDGTWKHRIFSTTMEGAWKASEDPARPGIVLVRGSQRDEDFYVQRRPGGSLFLQRAKGGAGRVATILPPEVREPAGP